MTEQFGQFLNIKRYIKDIIFEHVYIIICFTWNAWKIKLNFYSVSPSIQKSIGIIVSLLRFTFVTFPIINMHKRLYMEKCCCSLFLLIDIRFRNIF